MTFKSLAIAASFSLLAGSAGAVTYDLTGPSSTPLSILEPGLLLTASDLLVDGDDVVISESVQNLAVGLLGTGVATAPEVGFLARTNFVVEALEFNFDEGFFGGPVDITDIDFFEQGTEDEFVTLLVGSSGGLTGTDIDTGSIVTILGATGLPAAIALPTVGAGQSLYILGESFGGPGNRGVRIASISAERSGATVVPLPPAAALLGVALVGLALTRRRTA